LSSYCNLLYYAFRPKATHKQYTRSWNEYIVKIMRRSFFEKSLANADFACKVFMALSWNSTRTTKVWKEARAHDNAEVEPEELPTIDAKWLRKNCGTVLQMFKLIFSRGSWVQTTTAEYGLVATAWKHFAKSLGEAASKEIKASTETVQACAYVVGFVQQLWQEGPQAVNSSEDDIDSLEERLSFVLSVVIAEIGPGPFADVLENGTISLPATLLHNFASAAVDMKNSIHGASKQLGGTHLVRSGAPSLHLLEKTLSLLDKRLGGAYKASAIDRRDVDGALELITICLRDIPEDIAILTLQTMQSSLLTWLEDRERSTEVMDVNESLRIEVAEKFAKVVIPSLGSLPPRMVENLDGLFAAGFRSTHKDIINQMVGMWNTSHGQVSQLIYGPDLIDALSRLRPFVQIELADLNLPNELSTTSYGESAPPAFLDFTETQRPLATTPIPGDDEEFLENIKCLANRSDKGIEIEPQLERRDSNEHEAVPASQPQSSHSTPQRSRRHNDSQLQFQPVDSSPPTGMEEESQMLTDRQKEVRERQRQEASVYFADLRTDAAPKLAKPLTFNGEKRPSTPTLPSRGLADFDNNPTASPTPRSKHQALRLEDMDTPSSPLFAQVEEDALVPETTEVLILDETNASECPDLSLDEDVVMEEGLAPTSKDKLSRSPEEQVTVAVENSYITNAAIEVDSADVSVRDPDRPLHDRGDIASRDQEIVMEEDSQGPPDLSHEGKGGSSSFRLTSDEIDMMSQSQLSQDLDSYVISEHGDTPEPILVDKEQEHIEETIEPSVATTSKKKRKRRTSSTASSKKMKSQSFSRSVSESSQDTQKVLHDCIVVDISSRMPITEFWALTKQALNPAKSKQAASREDSTVSPDSANAANKAPKADPVEMPPPSLPASAANGLVFEKKTETVEVVIDSSLSDEGAPASEQDLTDGIKEAVTGLEEQQTVEAVTSSGRTEVVAVDLEIPTASATSRSSGASTSTEERAVPTEDTAVQTTALPQHNVGVQAGMGIIESLQEVLDRLRKSSGEGLGLRAIDDLCFQIRTEGQNAVNRGRESH
jgi:hypothetical protein